MYSVFLALRYARSRAVTYLALLTVSVSVASFVVVMSVLGGFRHKVEDIIQKLSAPLDINCSATYGIPEPGELAETIAKIEGVKGTSPYVDIRTMLRTRLYRTIGVVRGVELDRELKYGRLRGYLRGDLPLTDEEKRLREEWGAVNGEEPPPPPTDFEVSADLRRLEIPAEDLAPWEDPDRQRGHGSLPIFPSDAGQPGATPPPEGIIVGVAKARDLGLDRGDEVILTAEASNPDEMPRSRSFTVIGFYESETRWLDELLFIDRRAAEDLTGSATASGISIWLDDNRDMAALKEQVAYAYYQARGSGDIYTEVRSWRETNPDVFMQLDIQDRVMMIILLIFFVMTGGFIMAILWVLVADKTRDIGTVRALGGRRLGVMTTFVSQGMAIGVLGVLLGMGTGFLLSENINAAVALLDGLMVHLGMGRMFGSISRGLFLMDELPIYYDPVHLVSMVATTIAVSFLASLLPAWRAARLDPVEALRHE